MYTLEFIRKYCVSSAYSILGSSCDDNVNDEKLNIQILRSKIAVYKFDSDSKSNPACDPSSVSNLGPIFNPAKIINKYKLENLIEYQDASYVMSIDKDKNEVIYFKDNKLCRISYSQVFVCCGCINSIYLMESLKKKNRTTNYQINIAPSISFPLISFRKRNIIQLKDKQNYLVPTDFVIIKNIKGVKDSTYCQISQLNSSLLKYARLPKVLRFIFLLFSPYIFIAQMRLSSQNAKKTTLKVKGFMNLQDRGRIIIDEPKSKFYNSALNSAFSSISKTLNSKGFYTNKIFLLIYKLLIGQDSCGWHIGTDLSKTKDLPISLKSFSVKNVHFNDSCSLNKIPSTTIFALLYGRSKMLTKQFLNLK